MSASHGSSFPTRKSMDSIKCMQFGDEAETRLTDGVNDESSAIIERGLCHDEHQLVKWCESHGTTTKLNISWIDGFGRGALARMNMNLGEIALEIPASVLISDALAQGSDMYNILKNLCDVSSETLMLLWTMKERHNSDSQFRIYFDTLPQEFKTGLSFGYEALMELDGTLLLEELMQARQHLRDQYDELVPFLCENHSDVFSPELYTWENYLWACELWYSNGMKVLFPDGKYKTCLIPLAGFLNHSLEPHVATYGKVDTLSNTLKFELCRPLEAGEQCFLLYGNFPSSHFLTFYGFMPDGDNPFDGIPIEIDGDDKTHLVNGSCLLNNRGLFDYGLPTSLLESLRNAKANAKMNDSSMLSTLEIEMDILNDLRETFSSMLEALGDFNGSERENLRWDVKLALKYKELQRRLLSSIVSSCAQSLDLVRIELLRVGARSDAA